MEENETKTVGVWAAATAAGWSCYLEIELIVGNLATTEILFHKSMLLECPQTHIALHYTLMINVSARRLTQWCINASVLSSITDLGNGLAPNRCQAIA